MIEVVAEGIPAGLGAPIYGKLDGELASALMSINAVKGVEIGDGFAAASFQAKRMPMRCGRARMESRILSNHAGGYWAAFPPARNRGALCGQADVIHSVAAQDHRYGRQ